MERRVAVLLHHGLGDVIMSRKLIDNIRSFFVNEKIKLVVKSNVEKKFLDRLAVKLEISDDKYKQILKNFLSVFKTLKFKMFLSVIEIFQKYAHIF